MGLEIPTHRRRGSVCLCSCFVLIYSGCGANHTAAPARRNDIIERRRHGMDASGKQSCTPSAEQTAHSHAAGGAPTYDA